MSEVATEPETEEEQPKLEPVEPTPEPAPEQTVVFVGASFSVFTMGFLYTFKGRAEA